MKDLDVQLPPTAKERLEMIDRLLAEYQDNPVWVSEQIIRVLKNGER